MRRATWMRLPPADHARIAAELARAVDFRLAPSELGVAASVALAVLTLSVIVISP